MRTSACSQSILEVGLIVCSCAFVPGFSLSKPPIAVLSPCVPAFRFWISGVRFGRTPRRPIRWSQPPNASHSSAVAALLTSACGSPQPRRCSSGSLQAGPRSLAIHLRRFPCRVGRFTPPICRTAKTRTLGTFRLGEREGQEELAPLALAAAKREVPGN